MNKKQLTAMLMTGCLSVAMLSGCGNELKPDPEFKPTQSTTMEKEKDLPKKDISKDEAQSPVEESQNENSKEIEIEGGKIYSLPLSVNKLLEDGWTLAADVDAELAPNAISTVTKFERDGKSLITQVENTSDEVKPINECYVSSVSMQTESDASVKIGGFTIGSSLDELKEEFGSCEVDADGNATCIFSANKQMKAHFADSKCDAFSFVWAND